MLDARKQLLLAKIGICTFVFVKLLWIWIPVSIMALPRLGDDSLVYLWWGQHHLTGKSSQVLSNTLSIHNWSSYATPAEFFERNRVTMRIAGAVASPLSLFGGSLVGSGFDPGLVFAFQETIVLTVLTLGLAAFLSFAFGRGPAGIALALLAFTFLPAQGLHYLIPGVFSLGIALLLFRLVLTDLPLAYIFTAAFLCLITHQIGLIYVALAAGLAIASTTYSGDRGHGFRVVATLALAIAIARLWNYWWGIVPESGAGRGSVTLSFLGRNAVGVWREWSRHPFALTVAGLGAVWGLFHVRLASPILWLTVLVTGAMAASLAYDIPGYPGDVGIRLSIILFILASGAVATAITRLMSTPSRTAIVGVAMCGLATIGLGVARSKMWANVNLRYEGLNFEHLRKLVSGLPEDTTILYAETDVAMLGSVIAGAHRLGAIPYPMIRTNPGLGAELDRRRPTIIALIPPRALSGSGAIQSRRLGKRFYGYRFDEFRQISITKPQAAQSIYLRLADVDSASQLSFSLEGPPSSGCTYAAPETINGGAARWIRISAVGCTKLVVEPRRADNGNAIDGLSMVQPNERISWPWGWNEVGLSAQPWSRGRQIDIEFSWPALLRYNKADRLEGALPPLRTILSDRSGIIFAQLSWK